VTNFCPKSLLSKIDFIYPEKTVVTEEHRECRKIAELAEKRKS
jgi:hypothetical protein